MIARAPGKVVLSGAYAVLEGAPALVAAVDRYVIADTRGEPPRVTPEVAAALAQRSGGARAPWFDARALRDDARGQKLGLGSSAAILVASLAALELSADDAIDDRTLADRIFGQALLAHRSAQGGGSGIDVAASTFGGVLGFRRASAERGLPAVEAVTLPASLYFTVWSSAKSASTAEMLERVRALAVARPSEHGKVMRRLFRAAEEAYEAQDAVAFVGACREQLEGLTALGELAGAPIVTPEVRAFDKALTGDTSREAVVLPSGAGGGDVVLCVGTEPCNAEIVTLGRQAGLFPLSLSLGARGVHADRPSVSNTAERTEATP